MSQAEMLIPNQECLACGARQESTADAPWGDHLPVRSSGVLGSVTFDGGLERYIQFAVCGRCIESAANKGRVLLGTRTEGEATAPVQARVTRDKGGVLVWRSLR